MGSTNKTAHYELPQFVANDKPSWLGDVNEAMEAIDTGIYGAKSSADGAQQTANNAVAGVQSAGTRMDGIQTQLDTVATQANQTATTVAGHTSSIATNSANINTLNSRMGSTDISAIGDGTVTGAISSIAQGGGAGAWREVLSTSLSSTYQQYTMSENVAGKDVLVIGYYNTQPNSVRAQALIYGTLGWVGGIYPENPTGGNRADVLSVTVDSADGTKITLYSSDTSTDRCKVYVRD